MQKSQIISFIKRYYLGNKTEAAQWDTFENKLEAPFITSEKVCMGTVRLNNFKEFEAGQTIGILNTTPLLRQLDALNENKKVITSFTKLEKEGVEDRVAAIEFTEEQTNGKRPYSTKFMCADLTVVPRNTGLKQTPEWDLLFNLDNEFVDKFIKSQTALETKEFQVSRKGDDYYVLVGQASTRNSTMGEVPLPVEVIGNDVDLAKFPAVEMKEILSANKGGEIKLRVSGRGLAWVEIKDGDFECNYYLLSENL